MFTIELPLWIAVPVFLLASIAAVGLSIVLYSWLGAWVDEWKRRKVHKAEAERRREFLVEQFLMFHDLK